MEAVQRMLLLEGHAEVWTALQSDVKAILLRSGCMRKYGERADRRSREESFAMWEKKVLDKIAESRWLPPSVQQELLSPPEILAEGGEIIRLWTQRARCYWYCIDRLAQVKAGKLTAANKTAEVFYQACVRRTPAWREL